MFYKINDAIENICCKGAVLEEYDNGDKLIDADILNRNHLVFTNVCGLAIAGLIAGVGAIVGLVKNG